MAHLTENDKTENQFTEIPSTEQKSADVIPISKLHWANAALARGFKVLPLTWTETDGACCCGNPNCESPGKHPLSYLVPNGVNDATNDPRVVERWWRATVDANIGIPGSDKLCIVDLDRKNGVNGLDSLAEFLGVTSAELEKSTYMVRTASGSWHLYFAAGQAFSNRVRVLPGVDIRSAGAYVVGPGSTLFMPAEFGEGLEEVPYLLANDVPLAPLPAKLETLLRAAKTRESNNQESTLEQTEDAPSQIAWARKFLEKREPAIAGQGGNNQTYVTALKVRGMNISEAMCYELMMEIYNPRCEPEWSADDMEEIVAHAYQYAKEKQGSIGNGLLEAFDDVSIYSKPSQLPEDFHEIGKESSESRWSIGPISKARAITVSPIIERFIPAGMRGLFYGGEQSLKTTVAVKVAVDIAMSGVAFHGDAERESISYPISAHGAVLYLALEDGPGVKARAREAILDRDPGCDPESVPLFVLEGDWKITSHDDLRKLMAEMDSLLAAKGETLRAVFIDTTVFALDGDESEDKAETVTFAYAGANAIIRHYGGSCSVIFIHHTGKDESKGARGSYNWQASSEFRYQFKPQGERQAHDGERVIKYPESVKVICEKLKNSAVEQPIIYRTRRKLFEALRSNKVTGESITVMDSVLLLDVVTWQEAKQAAGVLSDLDIALLVVDSLPEHKTVRANQVAIFAGNLGLLPGTSDDEMEPRVDAYSRRLRRSLDRLVTSDSIPAELAKFKDILGPLLRTTQTPKKGAEGFTYAHTFTGAAGSLNRWSKYQAAEKARREAAELAREADSEDDLEPGQDELG